MATAYIPPGVSVSELTTTVLAPLLAVPGSPVFVGITDGYLTASDAVQLIGSNSVALPSLPAGSSSVSIVSVADITNPIANTTGYVQGTDYLFTSSTGSISRDTVSSTLGAAATPATGSAAQTITLASSTTVPTAGEYIRLTSNGATTLSSSQTFPEATITVASTSSFPSTGGTLSIAGVTGTITYTGTTSTTFTGCTGGSGTGASGAAVTLATTTETNVVASVSGTAVTLVSDLANNYASGATVQWGTMPDGDTFRVTYQYTPSNYFLPTRLTTQSQVESLYGTAWNAAGTQINSPLAYATSLAFANGAPSIVCQPLYAISSTTGAAVQPTAAQAVSPSTWQTVFTSLIGYDDINIIVPVIGQGSITVGGTSATLSDTAMGTIEQYVQSFVAEALEENTLYVAIVGEDATQSSLATSTYYAQESTLLAHAAALIAQNAGANCEQMVFVNTAAFAVSTATGTLAVGGQYVAAAIAGMLAGQGPATTLTRQTISGINSVLDTRTAAAKNNDAGNGMLVVENQGTAVWVRHAITMNLTNAATRELNVVRAKQYVINTITDALNTQVIGKVVADSAAPTLINNLMIGELQELQANGVIIAYSNIATAQSTTDQTTMSVTFTYQPAFIVNYINVTFSLDLTGGTVSASSTSS